jgi:ABC-type nitrate/sulfonate/bicarbonate transport system permease component
MESMIILAVTLAESLGYIIIGFAVGCIAGFIVGHNIGLKNHWKA